MRTEQIELFQEHSVGYVEKEAVTDTNKFPETIEERPIADVIIGEPVPNYFTSAYDICNTNYPEEPMLIEDLLPNGIIGVCAASSDVGKSMFWRQACACIAMKRDSFVGKKLNYRYGRAAYISTEDNERVFKNQYSKWSLNPGELNLLRNLHIKVETGKFPNKSFYEQVHREPYDLIVLDVLSDIIGNDMNDALVIREYFSLFKPLIQKHGTTVLFIHHINKSGDKQGGLSKNHVLGSSAIESASRALITISKDEYDHSVRKVSVLKCNSFPELKKNKPFKVRLSDFLWFEEVTEDNNRMLSTAKLEEDLNKRIFDLSQSGKSHRYIAQLLTGEGFIIGKTKVGEILKRTPVSQN